MVHQGSTFCFTGAIRYGFHGRSFHNTISADQIAAGHLGRDTRYPSSVVGNSGGEGGHGGNFSWNWQGKPVAETSDPVAGFHKLFSDDKTPLEQRRVQIRRQQSVLDTVLEEALQVASIQPPQ